MKDQEKKLEDFGEHIAGAKKETYFRVIDVSNSETKKLPLSKLWSDKDIMAIEDKQISALAYAFKDSMPNKPRQEHKLNRWLNQLQSYQSAVVQLLEANNPNTTELFLKEFAGNNVGGKARLLSELDRSNWKRISDIGFYKQTTIDDLVHLSIKIDGITHKLASKQSQDFRNFDSKPVIDDLTDNIKDILVKQKEQSKKDNEKSPKIMTAKSFDIYQRRADETAFISAKTDRQKTALISFKDVSEAREYLKDPENIEKLSQLWTEHREFNSIAKADMRNTVNEERTGQSYRDHDITPDEFMATFGVRGGQFGNWVTGDERQQMLNATYDGFMDLSKALNIEPKAIGLNGSLGIAFGARGSGSASAHYERGEQVINLTKTRGAGSLAHEWWHALDHYMKNGDDLLTRHLRQDSTARHQELIAPVRELVKGIHKSELYSRSQTADAYRSPAYFSTDVEMTARAFEGHIQHTLSTMGIKNDFLVNIRAEKNWQKNLDAYPYPKAEELESLGKAYNAVFDTLKEVDKEFVPAQYEPEQIIHADTSAINEVEKTKENQTFALDTYLNNNGFTQDNHDIWQKEISGYDEKLIVYGYPNSPLDISLGDNRSTLIAKMDENISLEEVHQAFTESWYSDLVEWRLDSQKTQDILDLEQEHIKQSLSTANEPQAQTVSETSPIQQRTIQTQTNQLVQPTPLAQQQQATAPTPNISQYKTKLNTPYAEKDQAKALGAKWDNANKTWYAPAGLDLNQFKKWLPQERQAENSTRKTSSNDTSNRIYLYTQPSDNPAIQELKAQGIVKFDLQHKLWFAHKDNRDTVRQWTTRPYVPTPEQALTEHLRSMGIAVATGHPIFDERPHRLANEGSNDKNVMYHAYPNPNGVPYARITNFSRNGVSEWIYPTEHLLALRAIEAVERANGRHSPIQSSYTPKTATAPRTAPRTEQAPQKDPEKIALENKMAERAKMLMSFAPVADTKQNYLAKKQVTANNVARIVPDSSSIPEHLQAHIAIGNTPKQYFYLLANNPDNKLVLQRGNLVIPQTNAQGEIRAFETIAYNGKKYALKDAEKKSMMTALGSLKDGKPIIMAEGYATGATLHENTGQSVVVAFGKNGLVDIAKELRSQYPNSKIYIGADNDHNKEVNAGLIDAVAVQQAVQNVYILVPQFEKGDTGKDWNDVLVDKGVDEFKRQIKAQLAVINPQNVDKMRNQTQAQSRLPVYETIQKHPLDPDVIRQNYPTMSEENISTIQMWRNEIPLRYADEPIRAELALSRLENKLPQYAQGEVLPAPRSQTMKHKPPENTMNQPTPQAQQIDNQQGGWKL